MTTLIFLGYSVALIVMGHYFGSRKRDTYDDVGELIKLEKRRKKKQKL